MDTTQEKRSRPQQENRPKTVRPRTAQPVKKRPDAAAPVKPAAPQSAQQRKDAARTAEAQKARSANPQKKAADPRRQNPEERRREDSRSSRAYRQRSAQRRKQENKEKANAIASVFGQVKKTITREDKKKGKAAEKKQQPKTPTPAVIYTQPQQFNRSRLLIQLTTVLAVVLALVMGLSVFFKVKTITVTGAQTYSAWAIREASGISEGDNLLTFSKIRAGGQIKANLPYVKTVRIGIKLPDTVNIMIEEEDVVYSVKASDGTWWLITSGGRVVEQTSGAAATGYSQVLGVTLENPVPQEPAMAQEDVPTETDEFGELIPLTVTGAQRLNAALQILKALEANDIVGEAASVDVSRLHDIILWYGTRYQVMLGDSTRLEYKIACMNDVVLQMSDYQSGVLDISFNHWANKVGYTPFE